MRQANTQKFSFFEGESSQMLILEEPKAFRNRPEPSPMLREVREGEYGWLL